MPWRRSKKKEKKKEYYILIALMHLITMAWQLWFLALGEFTAIFKKFCGSFRAITQSCLIRLHPHCLPGTSCIIAISNEHHLRPISPNEIIQECGRTWMAVNFSHAANQFKNNVKLCACQAETSKCLRTWNVKMRAVLINLLINVTLITNRRAIFFMWDWHFENFCWFRLYILIVIS